MTKLLIATAAAALAFVAPATAKERVFTHEGVTYAYTSKTQGNAVVLEGTASKGGKFRFVVKGNWVDGYAGGTRVSFRAPKREAAVLLAQR